MDEPREADSPDRPILEIDAGDPFWSRHSALTLLWKDPVFALFAITMVGTKLLPLAIWATMARVFVAPGIGALGAFFARLPLLFVFFPVIWLCEFLALRRYVTARSGHVAFFRDKVVLSKEAGNAELAWSELASFRDDSSDYVQLLRRGEKWGSPVLAVPTPGENERVSVLALLDSKNVPRRTVGHES
ncbi:hypothetical protein HY251_09200 [bacterium]|nr:hypothetical protein [bacterium]